MILKYMHLFVPLFCPPLLTWFFNCTPYFISLFTLMSKELKSLYKYLLNCK